MCRICQCVPNLRLPVTFCTSAAAFTWLGGGRCLRLKRRETLNKSNPCAERKSREESRGSAGGGGTSLEAPGPLRHGKAPGVGRKSLGRCMKMKYAKGAPKKASEKVQNASNPFAGKIFYLDLTSKVVSEKLEKDIKELGGTVEGFLSKEITFLITNKKVAANPKILKLFYSKQPEPERNTGDNSACQSGEGGSRKKTEKALLPENSILSNALNWGVRIMHVDEAKLLIEVQKQFGLKPKKEQTQHSAAPPRPSQLTAKKHVSNQKHRRFAEGPYYQNVDSLIAAFEFDFVEWPRFRKHCQCIGVQVPRVPLQNCEAQYISPIEYMEVDIIRVANPGGPHSEVHSLDKTSNHSVTAICPPHPGVMLNTSRITDSISLQPENNAAPLVCFRPGLPLSVGDEEMLSVANVGIASPVNERLAQDAVAFKVSEPEQAANLQKLGTESMDEVRASLVYPSGCVTTPDMDSGSAALSHRTAQGLPKETNECKANPEDSLLPNQLVSPVAPQSEGSDSRKLIRKVKTLKRSRNTESQPCTPTYYKVSVIQKAGPCTAQDSLLKFFESSNKDSEFFGFTCDSVESSSSKDLDNMTPSDLPIQGLFSYTSSSFSTFEGF
uniref:BRCT domain-containing protein n=1 Tax=Leptobrachium leishanense TaxID=445787 RepID=A0A8C5R485_9ANUR